MQRRLHALLVVAVAAAVFLAAACGGPAKKTTVSVFAADSLIIPFGEIQKAYAAKHPEVDLQIENHGSIQVIRHVTDIHEPIDVVVTADDALIPMLMYKTTIPGTTKPYAGWYVKFATNKLGLAYTAKSKFADSVTPGNWFQVLARPGVHLGIADPRFDATGYRGLMALQLAKSAYGKPTSFEDVIMGQFRTGITVRQEGDQAVIHVPELLEPKADSSIVMRGASIELIALLDSGDVDYAFMYESVAAQHHFKFVKFDDSVNLGSEQYATQYRTVRVSLDFQRFASVQPEFTGGVIGYGITIPASAPHPDEAAKFVAFALGKEGQAIMTANSHPLILPAQCNNYASTPKILQSLCTTMP